MENAVSLTLEEIVLKPTTTVLINQTPSTVTTNMPFVPTIKLFVVLLQGQSFQEKFLLQFTHP